NEAMKKASRRQSAARRATEPDGQRSVRAKTGRAMAATPSAAKRRSGAEISAYRIQAGTASRNGNASASTHPLIAKRPANTLAGGASGDWNQPFIKGKTGLPNSRHMSAIHGPAKSASAAIPPAA